MSEVTRPVESAGGRRFDVLAIRYLANDLDTTDTAEFRELLVAEPARFGELSTLALYSRWFSGQLSQELQERHAASQVSESIDSADQPSSLRSPGRTTAAFNRPVYWSMLAAGLLFAAYFVSVSWNMLGKKLPSGTDGDEMTVATIRDTQNAEWSNEDQSSPRPSGEREPGGEGFAITQGQPLTITSGLVEIQLKRGTILIVEGPAEWSIDGENSATLTHGKLVAKVSQQAIGFTLETPTATIVDLGTEFGVEVSGKHKPAVQVEVIQGKVRMQPGGAASDSPRPHITLSAGESRRISVDSATGSWVVEQSKAKTAFVKKIESKAPPKGSVISREQIVIEDSGLLPTASSAQSHFQPAADDLLQTALDPLRPVQPSADTKGRFESQLLSHLFNGQLYDPKIIKLNNTNDSFTIPQERSVEFFFDTTRSPRGYTIQRIESFSGAVGSRAGQRYLVFVRFKGRSSFESTAWLSVEVPRGDRSTVERKVSIAGRDSRPLASGVDAIAFMFLNFDGTYPEPAYREIDVIGVPTP